MKEFIAWRNLECDSVNGDKIQITLTFSSFDRNEIEEVRNYCNKYIGAGVMLDNVPPLAGLVVLKEVNK